MEGCESFVDDLIGCRVLYSVRDALLHRSLEIQPWHFPIRYFFFNFFFTSQSLLGRGAFFPRFRPKGTPRHTGNTLESRKKHKVTRRSEKIGVTRCDTVWRNHTNLRSTHVFTKSENFLFCFKGVREHCRTFTKLFHQHQLYISS